MGSDDLQWHRPSPRLLTLRHLQVTALAGALALVGVLVLAGGATTAGLVVIAVAALSGLAADLAVSRRVAAWGYAERAEDLVVHRGVLFRRTSVVPYGRMQIVDVTAGPFERALGLASVHLHTAAATSDARIPGLDAAEAARLRDQLSAFGEHQATGL